MSCFKSHDRLIFRANITKFCLASKWLLYHDLLFLEQIIMVRSKLIYVCFLKKKNMNKKNNLVFKTACKLDYRI